jgi:DNA-binding NtrC family response regulator
MGRAVLIINANKSMNLVLMNILNKDFDFFCAADVYSGFTILKSIKEIEMIVIDLDEHCDDCLDFIHFIRSSKIHKKKVVVLSGKNELSNLNSLRQDESVQILIKPFNPDTLISSNSKYIRTKA